ncbi:lipopolysaccharide kinase InaA family protein [Mesonia ostreae]|uniref:Lipopolysaccharide kinase InaA family protein n=1 Tax=Mesonia ostreae TaxID=861110 RepID=A0ABU2KGN7_9FLAO|nr:lipopolysaccharide kinase InaA family protein [Mesonia ostreae]MDT0293878.1 lipopolysaccharide kinase InaA family protein [Mesonia ostreae]
MNYTFSNTWNAYTKEVIGFIKNFKDEGKLFGDGDRNVIKLFEINNAVVNIKSFKIPNLINQIAYRFFRKSKAQRSFEYAQKLKSLGIGTPLPVAYFENKSSFLFKDSFYVSEHLQADLTYRELTKNLEYPNHTQILKAFTRFTFNLHENHIEFLDHSPGNTLIQLNDGDYKFFLVDLNRMNFKALSLDERIKNFARLTTNKSMVKVMSDEYAKLYGANPEEVFKKMWNYTEAFQEKFYRKKRNKKRLKFWKK